MAVASLSQKESAELGSLPSARLLVAMGSKCTDTYQLCLRTRNDVLFYSAHTAIDIFEQVWTPVLLDAMKRILGEDWEASCRELVGETLKQFVPDKNAQQLDIYFLCTVMVKLNSRLVQLDGTSTGALCGAGEKLKDIMPFCSVGKADCTRHLFNVIIAFRNRVVHELGNLSPKEVLSSLLAMQELWPLLSPDAEMDNDRPKMMQHSSSPDLQRQLALLIKRVKFFCLPDQSYSTCNAIPKFPGITRTLSLKLLGLTLLRVLAQELQPAVRAMVASGRLQESADANAALSPDIHTCLLHSNGLEGHLHDMQGICSHLKQTLKRMKSAKVKNCDDTAVCWLQNTLRRNSSVAFPARKESFPTSELSEKLSSALDGIGGKNGLRNQASHYSTNSLTAKKLEAHVKHSEIILRLLCGDQQTQSSQIEKVSESLALLAVTKARYVEVIFQPESDCEDMCPEVASSLPIPTSRVSLVGREKNISRVASLLQDEGCAVVSGEAGIGKTAMAIEIAYRYRNVFLEQYWLSATSHSTLRFGLSHIGAVNNLDPRPTSKTSVCDLVDSALKYLKVNKGLLLVIDNVLQPEILDTYFTEDVRNGQTILCCCLSSNTERMWKRWNPNIILHELQPLSTEDVFEYLAFKCPRLCKRSILSDLVSNAEAWSVIQNQLGKCPLALELTARMLNEVLAKLPSCTVLQQPGLLVSHLQEAMGIGAAKSLEELQTRRGESRVGRSLFATMHVLWPHLTTDATTLLIALSYMCRKSCTMPLVLVWKYSHVLHIPSCRGRHCEVDQSLLQRMDVAIDKLCCLGLVHCSSSDQSLHISLLVQRSVFELVATTARITCTHHVAALDMEPCSVSHDLLATMLITITQRELEMCAGSQAWSLDGCKIMPLLSIAESLMSTCTKVSDVSTLPLTVWMGRCAYTFCNNLPLAATHYQQAIDYIEEGIMENDILALVKIECGLTWLRCGLVAKSAQLLDEVCTFLQKEDVSDIQDPCTGERYELHWLLHVASEGLLSAQVCLPNWSEESDRHIDSWMKVQAVCKMAEKAKTDSEGDSSRNAGTTGCRIGPLQGANTADPAYPSLPEEFSVAMDMYVNTDHPEEALDLMCEAMVIILDTNAAAKAPIIIMAIMRLFCAACSDHAVDFYLSLINDFTIQKLKELLYSDGDSYPCVHKVPRTVGSERQLSSMFYKNNLSSLIGVYSADAWFSVNLIHEVFSSSENVVEHFCDTLAGKTRIGYHQKVWLLEAVWYNTLRAIRWHIHPENYPDLIHIMETGFMIESIKEVEGQRKAEADWREDVHWSREDTKFWTCPGYRLLVIYLNKVIASTEGRDHPEFVSRECDMLLAQLASIVQCSTDFPVYGLSDSSVFAVCEAQSVPGSRGKAPKTRQAWQEGYFGADVFSSARQRQQNDSPATNEAPFELSLKTFIGDVHRYLLEIGITYINESQLEALAVDNRCYNEAELVELALEQI